MVVALVEDVEDGERKPMMKKEREEREKEKKKDRWGCCRMMQKCSGSRRQDGELGVRRNTPGSP